MNEPTVMIELNPREQRLYDRLRANLSKPSPNAPTGAWDLMLTYDRLPYMDYGRVDEFRWLAEQIVWPEEAAQGALGLKALP